MRRLSTFLKTCLASRRRSCVGMRRQKATTALRAKASWRGFATQDESAEKLGVNMKHTCEVFGFSFPM